MPIYTIGEDKLEAVAETNFATENILERNDLQRLLRAQIDIISPNTLVIAEEFGEFEGVRRRIDLLGIDTDANLIVIELKRTEDGGHMELQAIRYAAMVSTMTFDRAVEIYGKYLQAIDSDLNAQESLLNFLGWDSGSDDDFCEDVKIVLASAEFSKELTASVLWLNGKKLDISCFRLKPYKMGETLLLDVQKIIPLPETADYQVKLSEKKEKERQAKESAKDLTKFDVTIFGHTYKALPKRRAIFQVIKHLCNEGVTPNQIHEVLSWRANSLWRTVGGEVDSDHFKESALSIAYTGGPAFDPNRWFHEDDQLIYFNDATYALTKMWGSRTEEAIRNLLNTFPDHDISFEPVTII